MMCRTQQCADGDGDERERDEKSEGVVSKSRFAVHEVSPRPVCQIKVDEYERLAARFEESCVLSFVNADGAPERDQAGGEKKIAPD
jgi:hypothetical protein